MGAGRTTDHRLRLHCVSLLAFFSTRLGLIRLVTRMIGESRCAIFGTIPIPLDTPSDHFAFLQYI